MEEEAGSSGDVYGAGVIYAYVYIYVRVYGYYGCGPHTRVRAGRQRRRMAVVAKADEQTWEDETR